MKDASRMRLYLLAQSTPGVSAVKKGDFSVRWV